MPSPEQCRLETLAHCSLDVHSQLQFPDNLCLLSGQMLNATSPGKPARLHSCQECYSSLHSNARDPPLCLSKIFLLGFPAHLYLQPSDWLIDSEAAL